MVTHPSSNYRFTGKFRDTPQTKKAWFLPRVAFHSPTIIDIETCPWHLRDSNFILKPLQRPSGALNRWWLLWKISLAGGGRTNPNRQKSNRNRSHTAPPGSTVWPTSSTSTRWRRWGTPTSQAWPSTRWAARIRRSRPFSRDGGCWEAKDVCCDS